MKDPINYKKNPEALLIKKRKKALDLSSDELDDVIQQGCKELKGMSSYEAINNMILALYNNNAPPELEAIALELITFNKATTNSEE